MYKILKKSENIKNKQSGMTLIELMVVLVIFIIVAGLTIFDYSKFRSTASLQNLADDIALSVRRAQNYAIGVKGSQSSFSNGYGIHFLTTPLNGSDVRAGSNKTFIIFNDLNSNQKYDYLTSNSDICDTGTLSSSDECIDMLKITSADTVSSICVYESGNNTCTPLVNGYSDITFYRPDPDAHICAATFGFSCVNDQYSSVDVVIKNSENQSIKTINISNVGQINIK